MNLAASCAVLRFHGWSTFTNPEGQRKLLQRDCEEFLEVNYSPDVLLSEADRRTSCLKGMGAGEGIIS